MVILWAPTSDRSFAALIRQVHRNIEVIPEGPPRDARMYLVDPAWDAGHFDILYYRELLERAWTEIRYAFRKGEQGGQEQQGIPADQVQRSICAGQEI